MYQSQTKPRVVTKNLDDIIKQSTFSTKRNSLDDLVKCQRHLKTEPRHKNQTHQMEKHNKTVISQEKDLKQNQQKNCLSMSKHSLESKQKINFLDLSKIQVKQTNKKQSNNKNSQYKTNHPCNLNFTSHNNLIQMQNIGVNGSSINHENKSLYFNQADAIFTQLQDFLRQTRQSVLTAINLESCIENSSCQITNEMNELFTVFKEEVQRLVQRYTQSQANFQVLKPTNKKQKSKKLIKYNENSQVTNDFRKTQHLNGNNKTTVSNKQTITKKPKQKTFREEQLLKFESYVQRQNTVCSTIVPDYQEDNQFSELSTQTDAELLSMLVLKNKLSTTKRKYQNSTNPSVPKSLLSQKQERGVKQGFQGEYSFRNKHLFENMIQPQSKNSSIGDKRKNQRVLSSQKQNKENRQKSIYEIVLQENKRLKTGGYK